MNLDAITQCEDAERCKFNLLELACEALQVQAGTFFDVDKEATCLRVGHTHGVLPWRVAKGQFPLTRGICGWVAASGKQALVNDVTQDARFNQQVDCVTQFKTVSVLCVPVTTDHHVIGVLELINRHDQPFTPADADRLQTLVDAAARRLQELG